MTTKATDRIEKQILLRAPRSRVWRAITEPDELAGWTLSRPDRPLVPGAHVRSQFLMPGAEHMSIEFDVVEVVPETLISWRWHPNGVGVDLSGEPPTLVEFRLADAEGGTLLTVVESGFDAIPIERRAKALENEQGWEGMLGLLAEYLAK